MNREIKFRALLDEEWYYSDSQADAKKLGAKLGGSCIAAFMNRFYGCSTLSQYTGLKDINGTEIHEGHIVQDVVMGSNCQIVYTEYANFGLSPLNFKMDDLKYETIDPAYTETTLEVIGNIYQNPELLGKEVTP